MYSYHIASLMSQVECFLFYFAEGIKYFSSSVCFSHSSDSAFSVLRVAQKPDVVQFVMDKNQQLSNATEIALHCVWSY